MKYPDWNTEEAILCLEELEVEYDELKNHKKEILGVMYIFQVFQRNPEYQRAMQALLCPIVDLPLMMNTGYKVVNMIIKKRLEYQI